jgi:hypothetical protein
MDHIKERHNEVRAMPTVSRKSSTRKFPCDSYRQNVFTQDILSPFLSFPFLSFFSANAAEYAHDDETLDLPGYFDLEDESLCVL